MSRLLYTWAICSFFMLFGSTSSAYVVIESINVGDAAMDATSTRGEANGGKATGEVDELQGGELSGDPGFNTPSRRGEIKRGDRQGRQAAGNSNRYPRSSGLSGGGGGGAGGGAGGGGRRGGQSQQRRNRVVQTVVVTEENDVESGSDSSDDGTDVTVYDDGTESDDVTGVSANGGGGGGGQGEGESEAGGSISTITGTPEPSALLVWAIAGCCGYGVVRFRKMRRSC